MLPQRALRNESPVRWFARPSTATTASTSPVKKAERASEPAAEVSAEPRESVRDATETDGAELDAMGTPQPAPIAAVEANEAPVDDAATKKQATKKQATKTAARAQPAKKNIAKKAPRRRT